MTYGPIYSGRGRDRRPEDPPRCNSTGVSVPVSRHHWRADESRVRRLRLRLLSVLLIYCLPAMAVHPQQDARRFDAIRTGGNWTFCEEGDCGPGPGCVLGAAQDGGPAPPNAHVDFAVWPLSGPGCGSDYIGTYACDSPFKVDATGTQCQ